MSPLLRRLEEQGPQIHLIHGPSGVGKSALVCVALEQLPEARPRVYWEIPPLEEGALLRDLDRVLSETLGPLPTADRRDLLPVSGSAAPWIRRLEGILMALGPQGGVLVLDGFEHLGAARRRLSDEIFTVWRSAGNRARNVHLIVVSRAAPSLGPWGEDAPADRVNRIRVGARPFRLAAHSAFTESARAAVLRWSVFGDQWNRQPGSVRSGELGGHTFDGLRKEIIERVLRPGGDLHDQPLRQLERTVQAPQRYLGILEALASGPQDWAGIVRFHGSVGRGNQLAPYLLRLEAEGVLLIERPLGALPEGRRRRYCLSDPFLAFWFGHVFPVRSLIHRLGAEAVFARWIEPALMAHVARWLPVLARRWLAEHAAEALGAPAREVGALWGDDEPIDVAARLANGSVFYGGCASGDGAAQRAVAESLESVMTKVRFGIGRENRAPLLFVLESPDPDLKRWSARFRLAQVITPERLMGWP